MESIFGKKASTKPLSEASSGGPEPPLSTTSTSEATSSSSLSPVASASPSPACEIKSNYIFILL